jgi:hypothetical protein
MKRKLLDRLPEEFGEIWLRKKQRHQLRIRVLDKDQPKETRWAAQLPLQRACVIGWYGLDGFNNEVAIRGDWHGFEVAGRAKVRQFLAEVTHLLRRGLIAVRVDGRAVALSPVAPRLRPAAARRPVARAPKTAERSARRVRA